MNKILILFVVAALAAVVLGDPGIRVRFKFDWQTGNDFFMTVPHTRDMAEEIGWTKYERVTTDRPLLADMYCGKNVTCCALMDDNGYVGGFQTAYEKSKFKNATFDWTTQGFKSWNVEVDGVDREYWVITQYFVSDEYLALNKTERIASYDSSKLLQEDYVWYTGFYGDLYKVPVVGDDIPDAGFTKQSCYASMGDHYYWNMSTTTECEADTLFPYFPMVTSNELIGTGTLTVGIMEFDDNEIDFCEKPSQEAAETIVPRGPTCFYELAKDPGLTTMHVYYIDDPSTITCTSE